MDSTKQYLFAIALLIGMSFSIGAAEPLTKEQYKSKLLGSGTSQKEAISKLRDNKMHDLLPVVSEILKNEKNDDETIANIIDLYESYGEELEKYHPDFFTDYEWVLSHSQNDALIQQIVKLLYLKKDKRFMYGIIELITHRSSEVREEAFRYLDSFRDDRILPYILELGNSESPINRYYYLEALKYINDERATVHVSKLLQDPSPAIRSEAIEVVGRMNLKDRETVVLNMARKDSNYEVRKYGIVYAKNKQLKFRTEIFQSGIFDPHPEVREVSTEAISQFKQSSYSPMVSKALEKEDLPYLRLRMIDALLSMNSHGGGMGLIAALRLDPTEEVRKRAAFATGKLGAKMAIPSLIESLNKDTSVPVKVEVVRTLGVMKEKSAVPALLNKLKNSSEDSGLRKETLSSLEQIDDPKVMPIIFDLIEEESTEFQKNMKEVLRSMLYRYHGTKIKRT
jgi:HEAT repeat protein